MRRLLAVLLVLSMAGGAWWVLGDPRRAEAVATSAVEVDDSAFSEPVIAVDVGEPVTWTFTDRIAHDVQGDGWGSPELVDDAFAHVFTTPGTYDYVCSLHPITMRGRVVVGAVEGR